MMTQWRLLSRHSRSSSYFFRKDPRAKKTGPSTEGLEDRSSSQIIILVGETCPLFLLKEQNTVKASAVCLIAQVSRREFERTVVMRQEPSLLAKLKPPHRLLEPQMQKLGF